MSRTIRGLVALGALALGAAGKMEAQAAFTITPGASPAGAAPFGYVPLSAVSLGYLLPGFGDNTLQTALLPFPFLWGGQTFQTIGISSNGYVTVGNPMGGDNEPNVSLPNPAAPNGILAPFWTDLDPSAGGNIYNGLLTDGVNFWDVVDWEGVPDASDHTKLNTFEVWMRMAFGGPPVDDVSFAYGDMGGPDNGNATIGVENVDGTVGTNLYYNGKGTLPVSGDAFVVSSFDNPNAVPEPSTWVLMATGLGAVGFVVRRRRGRGETR